MFCRKAMLPFGSHLSDRRTGSRGSSPGVQKTGLKGGVVRGREECQPVLSACHSANHHGNRLRALGTPRPPLYWAIWCARPLGPLGSSSSQHRSFRRTLELILQEGYVGREGGVFRGRVECQLALSACGEGLDSGPQSGILSESKGSSSHSHQAPSPEGPGSILFRGGLLGPFPPDNLFGFCRLSPFYPLPSSIFLCPRTKKKSRLKRLTTPTA